MATIKSFARVTCAVFCWLAIPPSSRLLAEASPRDLPVVRTADLSSALQGRKPAPLVSCAAAASTDADQVPWKGDEGKEMARIAALGPIDLSANGAKGQDLRSALRAICEQAAMHYYIKEDGVMSELVTISGNRHPWEYLRLLASMYNLEIVYRNGFWNIYVRNSGELVAKKFILKHNTLERFKAGASSSTQSGSSSSATSTGASSGSSSSSNSGSLDRTAQSVFSVDSEVIVKEVQKFLGLQSDGDARIAGADGSLGMTGPRPAGKAEASSSKGMVTFNSDTNTLYVVATRSQLEMLGDWIESLDQPLKEIYIETKFLMTSSNPSSHTGVSTSLFDSTGIGGTLSSLTTTVSPTVVSSWSFPSAILSADDLSARLNLMKSSAETSTVQYPQQVTLSGHEVVLRSVRQVPIISNNNTTTTGSAVSNNSQVEFVDVGTVVSILPKILNDRDILLNISITVSTISGYQTLAGNSYPLIDNQTYSNQVIVESGYSLALGGLEQTLKSTSKDSIPLLGDIPFFGFLFSDTTKSDTHSVLTMVVTPVVLPSYNGANSTGKPQFTLPAKGTPPRVVFTGGKKATIEDVEVSIRGFSQEVEELSTVAKEGRGDHRARVKAQLLLNELRLMEITLDRERVSGRSAPSLQENIDRQRERLNAALGNLPDSPSMP